MLYARTAVLATLVGAMVCSPVRAAASPPTESARPVDSPELDDAPLPNQASGIVIPRDRRAQAWMRLPRAILFVPRVLLEVPFAVPRVALWAYDRYELRERFTRWFFNDDETLGLYPTVFVETGFGLNVGARFVYREILGTTAALGARAGYGGASEQELSAKLTSGRVLHEALELGAEIDYDVAARARFFGIGNGDLEQASGVALIDPSVDDAAVATRFRHDDLRVELAALAHLSAHTTLKLSGAYLLRSFGGDVDLRGDRALDEVYDTAALVGYDTNLRSLYGELAATYDSRRATAPHISRATPSTGWQLTGFGGAQTGVGDDPSRFARFGIDAQRYIDLWLGDRVLILRAYAEALAGDPARIPFLDLPKLGGRTLLRGYSRDRFRGHYAAATTIEYEYPIQSMVAGYLFVDAGRVWREDEELEPGNLRLGYGGGLQLHTLRSYLGRVFVASSIDGGLFFNLSFDPVFDAPTRVAR